MKHTLGKKDKRRLSRLFEVLSERNIVKVQVIERLIALHLGEFVNRLCVGYLPLSTVLYLWDVLIITNFSVMVCWMRTAHVLFADTHTNARGCMLMCVKSCVICVCVCKCG